MSEKKISLLDEQLINKIAAGEVVEDAASVIKELVENAIDAGASNIEVVTKAGGRVLITVSDNGSGIEKEELPWALCRHATSKIRQMDDLFALETFGFRGEALASIASVSKCSILSAVHGKSGHQITCEGGKILDCQLHPRQQGTTIEVRDLFFNVPVRKKFQKSIQSATREVHKVLMHMAFAFLEVSFRWINDEVQEFYLAKGRDLSTTMATFLGSEWYENVFSIEEKAGLFRLEGNISLPYFVKANRSGQHLFVNGRPIFSPLIANAVLEGYGTRLSIGKYPCFVLFLQLPAYQLDVNVHPQKKEVRFDDEKEIYAFVKGSIQKALEKRHQPVTFSETFSAGEFGREPSHFAHFSDLTTPAKVSLSFAPMQVSFSEKTDSMEGNSDIMKVDKDIVAKPQFTMLAVIDHFFLIERDKKHYLVDALAAQKRVLFEKIAKEDSSIAAQALLFPLTLELTGVRGKVYERHQALFQKLKIEMRSIGEGYFIVDALPSGIDEEKIYNLLDALTEEKEEKKIAFSLNHLIKRKIHSMHEAYLMVETLFACEQCSICPEGRPIILPWPEDEIRRLFL